jgi:hypothetical protein
MFNINNKRTDGRNGQTQRTDATIYSGELLNKKEYEIKSCIII